MPLIAVRSSDLAGLFLGARVAGVDATGVDATGVGAADDCATDAAAGVDAAGVDAADMGAAGVALAGANDVRGTPVLGAMPCSASRRRFVTHRRPVSRASAAAPMPSRYHTLGFSSFDMWLTLSSLLRAVGYRLSVVHDAMHYSKVIMKK